EKYYDNFTIKGLVASDGRPKAAMYECKRVFQGIETDLVDQTKELIRIRNRNAVKSLDDYIVRLVVREDGNIVVDKILPRINLAAGRDTIINISSYLPLFNGNAEYLADIHFLLAENTAWAEKGFEVASNQFALTGLAKREKHMIPANASRLEVLNQARSVVMKGKDFEITIDKANGALTSYTLNGKEQLFKPLLPHFTRPLTDNDRRGWKPDKKLRQWYEAELKLEGISVTSGISESQITSKYSLIHDSAKLTVDYHVFYNGLIKVDYRLNADTALPSIPKIGMQCAIDRSYDNITWYGRGLMENYIDRNYGFDAAIYSQDIIDFMEPYAVPQENGNRTDVRWMFLAGKEKRGILVVADSLLSMSAWPYTEENIESSRHTIDLKDAGYITLNIDLVQMGVGGNDSWSDGAAPLPKYQIPSRDYHYCFYLTPYKKGNERISDAVKTRY
ncbi:MAG: beta-galactosidase small subunit family protein, partial [Flavisolibacter sp.]